MLTSLRYAKASPRKARNIVNIIRFRRCATETKFSRNLWNNRSLLSDRISANIRKRFIKTTRHCATKAQKHPLPQISSYVIRPQRKTPKWTTPLNVCLIALLLSRDYCLSFFPDHFLVAELPNLESGVRRIASNALCMQEPKRIVSEIGLSSRLTACRKSFETGMSSPKLSVTFEERREIVHERHTTDAINTYDLKLWAI